MRQLISVLAISLALVPPPAVGEGTYDEPLAATESFWQALHEKDYEGAFLVLKPSENSETAHPGDLMLLAGMYRDEEFTNLGTQRERALKFWELTERAALTGFEAAVIELVNAFLWDDEILGYKSDVEVADCLDGIIEKRAYVSPDKNWLDPKMVKECLLLASSPAIGTFSESASSQ